MNRSPQSHCAPMSKQPAPSPICCCPCAKIQDFPSFFLLVCLRLGLSLAPSHHSCSQTKQKQTNKKKPDHFLISTSHFYSTGKGKFLQNPCIDDHSHCLTSFSLFVIFISLHSSGHFGKKFYSALFHS